MKNGLARALAIIALIFMVLFLAALTATIVDHTLLNGSVGYITLGLGVFVLMVFLALKADGRGFSITKMNNEIEMKKIEDEFKAQKEKEEAEKAENNETDEKSEKSETESGDKAASEPTFAEKPVSDKTKKGKRKNKK